MDYGYSFVKFSVRDEKVFHLALKILPEKKKKKEEKKKSLRNTKRAESKGKKYTPLSVKAHHPVAVGGERGRGQRRCEKADRGKRSRMNAAGRFGMDFQRR